MHATCFALDSRGLREVCKDVSCETCSCSRKRKSDAEDSQPAAFTARSHCHQYLRVQDITPQNVVNVVTINLAAVHYCWNRTGFLGFSPQYHGYRLR